MCCLNINDAIDYPFSMTFIQTIAFYSLRDELSSELQYNSRVERHAIVMFLIILFSILQTYMYNPSANQHLNTEIDSRSDKAYYNTSFCSEEVGS